ncbi:MAG: vWA domain-containing protein [Pseudomonadota bacterium]
MRRTGAALCLAALIAGTAPLAQTQCTEDGMIVFDGSGSMAEMGYNLFEEPRIFEARRAMNQAIPPIAQSRRLGLFVYGPGGSDACSGLDLRFPPKADAAPDILGAVSLLQPAGETPLTEAVAQAAKVLETTSGGGTVVLVTDGKETCGGQTCQLAATLADGAVTVHVIGFKVRGAFFAWSDQADASYRGVDTAARCLADQTEGLYVSAETVEELVAALHRTLGCQVLF